MPSWAVSGVVHFIGVIILALINVAPPPESQQISAVSPPEEKEEEVEEFKEEKMEINVTEEFSNYQRFKSAVEGYKLGDKSGAPAGEKAAPPKP